MRALVTGVAGFVGSHLAARLIELGYDSIIGIDNLRTGNVERIPSEVNYIQDDIFSLSFQDWTDYLEPGDHVFHLAAEKYNSSRSTPERLLQTNVLATETLATACENVGVKRLVFTSSLYVYGLNPELVMSETCVPEPFTLYGASKLMGEGILRSHADLSWNVARLYFIFGPHQYAHGGYKSVIVKSFERLNASASPEIFGDGLQELDYLFIDDCVDALIELARTDVDSEVFNVSSGVGRRIIDVIDIINEVHPKKETPIYTERDWTHGTRRIGDPSKLMRLTDWEPRTTFREGLRTISEEYEVS